MPSSVNERTMVWTDGQIEKGINTVIAMDDYLAIMRFHNFRALIELVISICPSFPITSKSPNTYMVSSLIFKVPAPSYRRPMGNVIRPVSKTVTMYIQAKLCLCFLHPDSS